MKPEVRGQLAFLLGAIGIGVWAGTLLVPLAALVFMALGGGFTASWVTERAAKTRFHKRR